MDLSASQSGEERAFRDAIGAEVSETCQGLIENRVQLLILNMAVRPINAILYGSVISHLVGRFKPNVSEAMALATHSSLTTVSFCRPLKNS